MSEKRKADMLEEACAGGFLDKMLDEYISFCKNTEGDSENDEKKKRRNRGETKFPNIAGFCRYFGIGGGRFEKLSHRYPEAFEMLTAVFEDEALNSEISPTVIAAYLKRRLSYEKPFASDNRCVGTGNVRVVFDHDIFSDGE